MTPRCFALCQELAAECDRKGWAFVQPVIRSSYAGYGCSSLANDVGSPSPSSSPSPSPSSSPSPSPSPSPRPNLTQVADVTDLVTYLLRTHDAAAFAVVGHSTGCQDV